MSMKIAIWSAVVEPGVETIISVPRDFTLTNAALGELLADPTGRSVLKLTHEVIPAKRFQDGYVSGEDSEEEDEEEEEGDVEMTEIVVTSLTAGKTEQTTLNLTFVEGEEISFSVTGSNIVHLSGNYIDQDVGANQAPDSDEEDFSDEEWSDADEDEDMEEDDDEMNASISEIAAPAPAKRTAAAAGLEEAAASGELSKSQKKKLNKKLKGENGEAAAAPVAAAPSPKAAKPVAAPVKKEEAPKEEKSKAAAKKTLASGLAIEDTKLGTGAVAKSGKKVGMRYIGKLGNGKVFDSNTNGKPFVFLLGKGEVIKGWDQGVAGMAIGGERKLTIPASLAYGSKALPGIPKNSVLHFEVKLVSVN
ncbi:hypothetical protein BDY24DRAFT_403322 [Mrakia frigida]|uniref:FKBP-type peptidyl-prolyl cis-trans isomerase n=1 Tax=Mrakia frigida TaxID=29902 RepID=UPI003FCC2337